MRWVESLNQGEWPREKGTRILFFHVNVQDSLELVRRYELWPVLSLAAIDRCEPLSRAARLSALPTIKAVLEALEKEKLCESRHHCLQLG